MKISWISYIQCHPLGRKKKRWFSFQRPSVSSPLLDTHVSYRRIFLTTQQYYFFPFSRNTCAHLHFPSVIKTLRHSIKSKSTCNATKLFQVVLQVYNMHKICLLKKKERKKTIVHQIRLSEHTNYLWGYRHLIQKLSWLMLFLPSINLVTAFY